MSASVVCVASRRITSDVCTRWGRARRRKKGAQKGFLGRRAHLDQHSPNVRCDLHHRGCLACVAALAGAHSHIRAAFSRSHLESSQQRTATSFATFLALADGDLHVRLVARPHGFGVAPDVGHGDRHWRWWGPVDQLTRQARHARQRVRRAGPQLGAQPFHVPWMGMGGAGSKTSGRKHTRSHASSQRDCSCAAASHQRRPGSSRCGLSDATCPGRSIALVFHFILGASRHQLHQLWALRPQLSICSLLRVVLLNKRLHRLNRGIQPAGAAHRGGQPAQGEACWPAGRRRCAAPSFSWLHKVLTVRAKVACSERMSRHRGAT